MTAARIDYELAENEYHADPALSSSRARRLLESPAKFHWGESHPEPSKAAFDLGTAVHSKVLGTGADTVAIPAGLLATNGAASTAAAKEFIAEARAKGLTPVKAEVAATVEAMTESVLAHPEARRLFEQSGNPEASVFATDPTTNVDMRARFDYLPDFTVDDPWTVDLKTTAKSAAPEEFARTIANLGYYVQQEWYLHAYAIATGDFMARMKFVVVETDAPHLVGVYSLATEFAEMGRQKVQRALTTYAKCIESGVWPGYDTNPDPIQPPTWLMFQEGAIS